MGSPALFQHWQCKQHKLPRLTACVCKCLHEMTVYASTHAGSNTRTNCCSANQHLHEHCLLQYRCCAPHTPNARLTVQCVFPYQLCAANLLAVLPLDMSTYLLPTITYVHAVSAHDGPEGRKRSDTEDTGDHDEYHITEEVIDKGGEAEESRLAPPLSPRTRRLSKHQLQLNRRQSTIDMMQVVP